MIDTLTTCLPNCFALHHISLFNNKFLLNNAENKSLPRLPSSSRPLISRNDHDFFEGKSEKEFSLEKDKTSCYNHCTGAAFISNLPIKCGQSYSFITALRFNNCHFYGLLTYGLDTNCIVQKAILELKQIFRTWAIALLGMVYLKEY